MKEGRGPFTPLFCLQTKRWRKAALLSPLCFWYNSRGEGRPLSVLATNREVKNLFSDIVPKPTNPEALQFPSSLRVAEYFTAMFRRKAFLHWYTGEGGLGVSLSLRF